MTTREEWLEARKAYVTGSAVATVMGLNPYETPLQLYMRKIGTLPETESLEHMEIGLALQPGIGELYADRTGRTLSDLGAYVLQTHDDYPYLAATLDYLIRPCEGHDMPGPLEIKMTSGRGDAWERAIEEDCPPDFVDVQLQAQMAIVGADWGSIAALVGGRKLYCWDVQRDDALIQRIAQASRRFMLCVQKRQAPPLTADDNDTMSELYPEESAGFVLELPATAVHVAGDLERAAAMEKHYVADANKYKAEIKRMMGDAEVAVLPDGSGRFSWKTNKNGTRCFRRLKP